MKKAVIYARYSSAAQTEQSIEGQLHVCYDYAEREDLTIVGEYIDRAMSGRYDDRDEFQRMIDDSKKKQFQYILVYKLDRFARNRYDSAVYKHKLKQNGVKVLSACEHLGDNAESILLEALLEATAEYYSVDLSQKVRRGLRESALKANSCGGTPPLGYKIIDKKLVIDKEKAEYVRYIYQQYTNGVGKKAIVAEMNKKGWRTNKGKPFTISSLSNFLTNKKYIGTYTYNGIEIEGGCPAIIDKETFKQAAIILEHNRHAPASHKAKKQYILQGKAYCGECGHLLQGETGRGKSGGKYYYYACSGRKRLKNNCQKRGERKEELEAYVINATLRYVLNPKRMEYIADKIMEQYKKEYSTAKAKQIELQIKQIEKQIAELVNTLIKTTVQSAVDIINDKLQSLEAKRNNLAIEATKLRLASKAKFTREQIIGWLKRFTSGDPKDESFCKKIIMTFIKSVFVYNDKIIIYYNLNDEIETYIPEHKSSVLQPVGSPNTNLSEPSFIFLDDCFGLVLQREKDR